MLAECLDELRFDAGELVFGAGVEGGGSLYVVAYGEVEASRAGDARFRARFGPGSIVCGTAALADELSSYAARATAKAVVLRLRIEDMFDVMEEHFDIVRGTMALLSGERERLLNLRRPMPETTTSDAERDESDLAGGVEGK